MYDKLTDKQQRFVDLWTGNAEETASLVPFANPRQAGSRALTNVNICRLIKATRDVELKPQVMSRIERQEFWTKIVTASDENTQHRLKASELLGKSEGDFIDRLAVTDDRPDIPEIAETMAEKDLKGLCKHVLG